MWSTNDSKGESKGLLPRNMFLGPLILMSLTPPAAILLCHTFTNLDGDFVALKDLLISGDKGFLANILHNIYDIWPTPAWGDAKLVGIFMLFQLLLMQLSGPTYRGPVTPQGNVPIYTDNGVPAFLITVATFAGLAYKGVFDPAIIYYRFGNLISLMNSFSLAFCLIIYFKGRFFPSSSDSGSSGNFLFDYYWGTELYPRIFGWDVKVFTNCRFGLMSWPIILYCYAFAQYRENGFVADSLMVSVGLQTIYVTKFFIWETGYLSSIDIMHDRAGFYLCWGCMVWVPMVYTSPSLYLVKHPIILGPGLSAAIFILGALSIYINFDSDRQRQIFRETKGKANVWGKKPEKIVATYTTEKGEKRESLLLVSGWWGIARHFHYLPELGGAFFWSCPGLFNNRFDFLCIFYFVFLCILLTDRAFRDDARCREKYGKHWDKYCARVPYKMIPYVL